MKNFLKTSSTLLFIVVSSYITMAQDTKTVEIKNINSVTVSSGIDLYLTQGNSESLNIKASADLLKNVVVELNGGNVTIKMKEGINWGSMFKNQTIKAYLNFKNLSALTASGGSDVYSQNQIKVSLTSLPPEERSANLSALT